MIRRYSELKKIKSFEERYLYLRLKGQVGKSTFGFERYLNQKFYTSIEWLEVRNQVIIRDSGCDLGSPGYEIGSRILIHHMNPISIWDFKRGNRSILLNPEFLITTTPVTHLAIHFGDKSKIPQIPIERRRWDTIPWR